MMMTRMSLFILALVSAPVLAIEPLSDEALASATGQEGIGLQLELRINTDANGQPLTNPPLAANAGEFANCGSLTNFSSPGCRLALKFANRNDGGGEWLVLKNFYGRLLLPLVFLDSGFTPAVSTSYVDLDRFKDKNGIPLLATPNNIPYLKLSFPKEIEIWNMTIGGLAIEYGATGYLSANNRSIGGIKISNSAPNLPATIDFQGSIGIFGF